MKRGASVSHIAYIEQYKTQAQIQDILGISPRYLRLIKEGKRSGAKYEEGIRALYDLLRRSSKPPIKRKRVPRKKDSPFFAYVPDVMNVLFKIFQPRTWKVPKRKYQDKTTSFFVNSPFLPRGEKYDNWDSFFIVLGVIPEGDRKFKRYKRVIVYEEQDDEEEEEEEEDDEVEEDDEAEKKKVEVDSIAQFFHNIDSLSSREKKIISHIPLYEWLQDAVDREIPINDSLFVNFWISRVLTNFMYPEEAKKSMVSIANDSIDIANSQSDDVQYFLLGVYGYSGWVSTTGG